MRILVTGARGMLGSDLCPLLTKDHEVVEVDIQDFDVTTPSAVEETVRISPQIVCHLAAATDVDGCELDPESACLTNGVGTRNIALACQRLKIPVLYLSTDYVFDGEKGEPYLELDHPNPINVYGMSKLQGEQYVSQLLTQFYIVRSSWLFGKNGRNFVDQILARARERGRLEVVTDQVGSPTYTADLAEALKALLETGRYGLYHITNSGFCSWFEFALEILNLAGVTGVEVAPIDSRSCERRAKRPKYSVLSNSASERTLKRRMRPWEEALADYLRSS